MAACSMCGCFVIKEAWLFAEIKEEKMAVGSLLCFYGLLSQNASTSLRAISAQLSWQQCKYFIQWICPAVCLRMCAMILQWECRGGCLNLYIISWQEFNGLLLERMFYVTLHPVGMVQCGKAARCWTGQHWPTLYKHTSSSNRNQIITPPSPLHSSGIVHMPWMELFV